ncbi:hypothetical protein BCF74_10210 [Knoellia remsis]|uniref:Uncharacterized protein n=1 Tax=Knoellia remsis TaxID=407159 RepID=A0A2T0UZ31_9MICO|nr:hypothetical protein [Knoellia remsis]PRY63179.1 hypothetical protein BCF74_10210 [Knoellia remsis]
MTTVNILEAKITVTNIALVIIAAIIAVAFTIGAFKTGTWAWLVAVPINIVGAALVVVGALRRRATDGSRGMAIAVTGGLFIVGSIWAAFMLGNALAS